jgi:alkanesulfonate monooxygenase SsuD/methylene tetrahydromethanopterin reductase-like flavin-dependent oxidoreductase (luciferase family)
VQWADALAYDEAWTGEHHSAGFEIIASPEYWCPGSVRIGANVTADHGRAIAAFVKVLLTLAILARALTEPDQMPSPKGS